MRLTLVIEAAPTPEKPHVWIGQIASIAGCSAIVDSEDYVVRRVKAWALRKLALDVEGKVIDLEGVEFIRSGHGGTRND